MEYTVFSQNTFFFFLETTMTTRPHSLTIYGQGSVISILQLPASASGYTRTPRLDLIPRVDMVVFKKKKVSTLLPEEKCVCTNCQRLFSSPRVQPNLGFSLVQVNVFFCCTEQINLLFIISNDSIFEQIGFRTAFQNELCSTTEV